MSGNAVAMTSAWDADIPGIAPRNRKTSRRAESFSNSASRSVAARAWASTASSFDAMARSRAKSSSSFERRSCVRDRTNTSASARSFSRARRVSSSSARCVGSTSASSGPGPEDALVDPTQRAELEETRRALEKERADAEVFVRSRTQDLLSKEELLFARERAIASKEEAVEAHARAATERLAELEKDSARREVLRFLVAIPGMSASQADVIATAFPDIVSLTAADEKALTQCKGVTDALARAIRLELAPGELEEERRSSRLREEAQAFVEEGDYAAALECYDRLLRSRPEETSVWFDRAELLVLLDRPE